ncbi:MAG: hypothetical protein ACK4UN_06640, partial [Limisphaerales bacterium]
MPKVAIVMQAHTNENRTGAMPVLVDANNLRAHFNPAPSLRTIRNWQKARLIPWIKISGKVYFNPAEVLETLAKKRTVVAR